MRRVTVWTAVLLTLLFGACGMQKQAYGETLPQISRFGLLQPLGTGEPPQYDYADSGVQRLWGTSTVAERVPQDREADYIRLWKENSHKDGACGGAAKQPSSSPQCDPARRAFIVWEIRRNFLYNKKEVRLRTSRAERGRFSDIFLLRARVPPRGAFFIS